jgi:hypothetical protein
MVDQDGDARVVIVNTSTRALGFIGAFAWLWKARVDLRICVCLSVCETTTVGFSARICSQETNFHKTVGCIRDFYEHLPRNFKFA